MGRRARASVAQTGVTEQTTPRQRGVGLSKNERLAALTTSLKGKHPGKVFLGNEYTMPWAVRRLPFGIADLDVATNGGLPAGGVTMLVGKPSEGKNYLLNRVLRNQQVLYGAECACAMIGTELPYDKTQGRLVGVSVSLSNDEIEAYEEKRKRLKKLGLTVAERGDLQSQVGTFLIVPPGTAEEAFDIAVELVKSGDFNVVGLDSFGSILAEGDEDKDLVDGDPRRGAAASLNTQLMRKLNNAFAPRADGTPNLTAFVGINQVRDKQDAQAFEKKTQESGGWALKHGRFLTVEIARKAYITDEKTRQRVAKTIGWEITKQKAGGYEGHVGEYRYVMAAGAIDEAELMLRLGTQIGLIEKVGNTYTYSGLKLTGQGAAAAAAALAEHNLVQELYDAYLEAHGVTLVT